MIFKSLLFKEITLVWRDKYALGALFIMPAIFILIMSMAMQDRFDTQAPLLHFKVMDQEQNDLSRDLTRRVAGNKIFAESTKPQDEAAFILTIPKGFTASHKNDQNNSIRLELTVSPEVQPQMLALFQSQIAMSYMALKLQRITAEIAPFMEEPPEKISGKANSIAEIMTISFMNRPAGKRPTSTQQTVPSWIVFGMFFVVIPFSTIIISERKQHTLMRMSAMDISVPLMLAGKIVPYIIINQLQAWLMIAVGIFVVPLIGGTALTLGNSLPALLLLSFCLSLAAIGTASLIAALTRTVEQATTIGGIINVLFGAIGGVMVPKFIMPNAMQQLTVISPMSWGLEGFLDIFLRGLGVEAILPEAAALTAFGGIGLLFAGVILQKKMLNS